MKAAERLLKAGIAFRQKGNIQRAKLNFVGAINLVGKRGPGRAALSELRALHAEGEKLLEEAVRLYGDEQYVEALETAKKTKKLYGGLFCGIYRARNAPNLATDAVALIEHIESDPQAIAAIQDVRAAKRYKRVERLERQAKEDPSRYYDLYKTLKSIVKHFPASPTAQRCRERLKSLKADKEVYALIKKESQRRKLAKALRRADDLRANGEREQADKQYKRLQAAFPGKSLKEIRQMAKKE